MKAYPKYSRTFFTPSRTFFTPSRSSLIIAIVLVALEGMKDERILAHRHYYSKPEDPEYTEDKLYIILTKMCTQLKTTGKLNVKDYGMDDGFVSDKLAFVQQLARISYEEWEEIITPN